MDTEIEDTEVEETERTEATGGFTEVRRKRRQNGTIKVGFSRAVSANQIQSKCPLSL